MRPDLHAVIYTDNANDIRWHIRTSVAGKDDIVLVCPDTFESAEEAKEYIKNILPGKLPIYEIDKE